MNACSISNRSGRPGWARLGAVALCCSLAALGAQAAGPGSCRDSAGIRQAQIYVRQCLEVSEATHPPCNAANPCDVIIEEIRRSCAMLAADVPAFCAKYLKAPQSR